VKDLIVVIRSSGERTFEACRGLVLKQVPFDALEVVKEQPFEKALRRTYEIGIHRSAKWTMTLDADVLLGEGAIKKFVAEAESMPNNFIQIEGLVHDKLTGLFRQAGHRIYRTKYLKKALLQIPSDGTEIRPEYATLQQMEKLGFPSRLIDLVVGIHDYEQYYHDIYRKAFVHANKHQIWLADIINRWKKYMATDTDFRIALRGLYDGLMYSDLARIDTREYIVRSELAMKELGLQEKAVASMGKLDYKFIFNILSSSGVSPKFTPNTKQTIQKKLKDHRSRVGLLKMVPFLTGCGLCRIGEFIKQFGKKLKCS
jgi:hypothetical protein